MSHIENYDDIINLPHHTSSKHPRMSMIDRAAQFSPFAALTGYDAAIKETARLTDERIDMDDEAKAAIDRRIMLILDVADETPEVTVTYFVADEKKHGGSYADFTGVIKRIDEYERTVVFTDKTKIPIDDIYSIDGDIFKRVDWMEVTGL